MRQTLAAFIILILLTYTVEWYYNKQRQPLNDFASILVITPFPLLR